MAAKQFSPYWPNTTSKTLLESAEHWLQNFQYAIKGNIGKIRHSSRDCALCTRFFNDRTCHNCPVKVVTHKNVCRDTPYSSISQLLIQHLYSDNNKIEIPPNLITDIIHCCAAEYTFLMTLLLEGPDTARDFANKFIADTNADENTF